MSAGNDDRAPELLVASSSTHVLVVLVDTDGAVDLRTSLSPVELVGVMQGLTDTARARLAELS